ncbi:MAG: hypothetical protein ACI923_001928 [Flavobacteriales bacterium]|jgi:hypothetical protein
MTLLRNLFCLLFMVTSVSSWAQMDHYNFIRSISEPTAQWHKIQLPLSVYQHINNNFTDLRVYGITSAQDTLEVPFIVHLTKEETTRESQPLLLLNSSHTNEAYYYTFEVEGKKTINEIDLLFGLQNFDWRLELEGSEDQLEWFTVLENYRILSIRNDNTSFDFTKLSFPNSNFRYYRLKVRTESDPSFSGANISLISSKEGRYEKYDLVSFAKNENEEMKRSELDVALEYPSVISAVEVTVEDTVDYYRNVLFKVCTDSVETKSGMRYNYRTVGSGTLNSLSGNTFSISNVEAKNLHIEVQNQDNAPLRISSVEISGEKRELHIRFTEPANYFLAYGNAAARAPQYDIFNFRDKIPAELQSLELGAEQLIPKIPVEVVSPLFENKWWLWGIMGAIVLLLGWFSVGMLKGK